MLRLLWSSPLSSMPYSDQSMSSESSPAEKHAEVVTKQWASPPKAKPQAQIPTMIAELQDLQDNEQLHRLVQLIEVPLLTGKLASLGFTLGTPVSSQIPQTTLVRTPIQSPSSSCPRSDLVLSPEASPQRANQGHLEKKPCPKGCDNLFKPAKMTQHLPKCSGELDAVQEQKKKAEAGMSRRLEARKQSSDCKQATLMFVARGLVASSSSQ